MYQYRTQPFAHQAKTFEATKDLVAFGIFWEQGTGKSKLIVDTAAYLQEEEKINGLLVVAPNGVHTNWITDELPTHLPERVLAKTTSMAFHSGKASTKRHQAQLAAVIKAPGFAVLAVTYDGFITEKGKRAVWEFLKKRKVLMVLDEAQRIKNPTAKRTRSITAAGKFAQYRRVLTGTPVANSPFDVHPLMKFADPTFWDQHELSSYTVFKQHFGIWQKNTTMDGVTFEHCVAYRRLDELNTLLQPATSRVTKSEVLDLPPKLYSKRTFEMTPQQKKLYEQLRDDFMTEFGGQLITAPLAIQRLIKLQQVLSGYLPCDGGDPVLDIPDGNPRLSTLAEIIEDLPHKAIIFARFSRDIELIMGLMAKLKKKAVRYDGNTSTEDRLAARAAFQGYRVTAEGKEPVPEEEQAQFFVGNTAAAGEGLTLHAAQTVVYYTNSFNLTHRLQSEDRAHRIGQAHPVHYVDICVPDTVDYHIVQTLVKKDQVAASVLGDRIREWL